MNAMTYREDLYYVQTRVFSHWGAWPNATIPQYATRERVVSRWRWWFYRAQFWRFEHTPRMVKVLRERTLAP